MNIQPSNWRCKESLEKWLDDHQVVAISGVDTRALVRHIRNFGAMNGVISNEEKYSIDDLLQKLQKTSSMEGLNLVNNVSNLFSAI